METIKTLISPKTVAWILVLTAAIVAPPVVGGYVTSMLILIAIWTIMCFSMNLIFGYTGQLSLGHSAFLGISAYVFSLITVKLHVGFWPAFLIAIAFTGIIAFLVGIPALKLRGPYFILVTLGFAVIVGVIVLGWIDLTGGANGLFGIPRPNPIPLPWVGTLRFDSLFSIYYFILFFVVCIGIFCHRLVHSLIGKRFIAISYNENLTESLGINTMSQKLLSFTISAILAGIAGVLYATYNAVISPELTHFARGMDVVAYLIVGGAGTMAGPIIGTMVLMTVPEVLQVLPYLKTLINGIILMLFILFLPNGIVGWFSTNVGERLKTRRSVHDPA